MPRMTGPKPKPTHLKLVKGVKHKARINRNEPVIRRGMPMAPEHLSTEAKVEWGRICEDLYDAGMLTKVDRAILAIYCQLYGRWVQAEAVLAEMARKETAVVGERDSSRGIILRTIHGNMIQNPALGAANKAAADVARYATDLGMTPSARSRVTAAVPKEEVDPAEKYLA